MLIVQKSMQAPHSSNYKHSYPKINLACSNECPNKYRRRISFKTDSPIIVLHLSSIFLSFLTSINKIIDISKVQRFYGRVVHVNLKGEEKGVF